MAMTLDQQINEARELVASKQADCHHFIQVGELEPARQALEGQRIAERKLERLLKKRLDERVEIMESM